MSVHRVVLDTNVIVSGIVFGGKPRKVLQLALNGSLSAYLSPDMLRELQDVLARPKFRLSAEFVHMIVEAIQSITAMVFPKKVVAVVAADPDDDAVIACAVAAEADFIITGDPHLLPLTSYRHIRIVSPANYLDQFHP